MSDTNSSLTVQTTELDRFAYEPRSLTEARDVATALLKSGVCPDSLKTTEAVLVVLMQARELGLSAMLGLRSIHVIKGKPTLSAQLMHALVLRSGLAAYFKVKKIADDSCTWVTQRKGEPEPTEITWTIAMAKRAGLLGKDTWAAYPRNMLSARACSELARLVYPDVIGGLYTPDEVERDDSGPPRSREPAPRLEVVPPHDVVDAEIVEPDETAAPKDAHAAHTARVANVKTRVDDAMSLLGAARVAELVGDLKGRTLKEVEAALVVLENAIAENATPDAPPPPKPVALDPDGLRAWWNQMQGLGWGADDVRALVLELVGEKAVRDLSASERVKVAAEAQRRGAPERDNTAALDVLAESRGVR